jgi:hypothetical protein
MFTVGVNRNRSSVARQGRSGAHRLQRRRFREARGRRVEHRLLRRRGRLGRVREAVDGGIAVFVHQRVQRLHQVEAGAVEARAVAGVHVLARPAAPLLAAGHQLQLHHALGAQRDGDAAIRVLRGAGHEHAPALPQRGGDFRPRDHLLEVRRADLLFALRHQHDVHRDLGAGAADGVQRGQERGLRPLLVDRAAAHHHLAEARLVDQRRFEGRRGPFAVGLLHVVHEVQADGARRARVQRGEYAGVAVGGHPRRGLEAGLAGQADHRVAALLHPAVLGRDGGLLDPVAQALEAFVVALLDLGRDAGGRLRAEGEP